MEQKESLIVNLQHDFGIDVDLMVEDARRYLPNLNEKKFREAFCFAARAHAGQMRKENKPYIIHPVETVRILISLHADEDMLIAAFLHDVPEDTVHTIHEIETKFGKKVTFLVNGITKLSKVHFRNEMASRQIESLKKLFVYTAEDPRIILIKLADRLHNMRTLQYIDKKEKRERISRETLEIFAPVANLLGIEELKSELEDLCFRYIHPDDYENVADRMGRNREKNQKVLEETIQTAQRELDKNKIKAMVIGRQKNLYTIYKKIVSQGKRLDELDNFIAVRILVPERQNCYQVLGILHTMFKPKPAKFKDYIAVPKINGYQSLHTTVFGLNGMITEFQIRTHQMHLEAEYGITARYFDNQNGSRIQLETDKRSHWVAKILELDKASTAHESFIDDLKVDILQDRIFIFTQKGDPIDLPRGATCIDFAYSIHSQVGHRALKADVNNEIVPMTTVLKTGDTVRIIVSDKTKGPDRKWLFFAKTSSAKNKIREYFKRESIEAKVKIGRNLMQREFDRAGLGLVKNISQKRIGQFCQQYPQMKYKTLEDIFIAVGDGTLNPIGLIHLLYPSTDIIKIGSLRLSTLLRPRKKEKLTRVTLKVYTEDRVGQLEQLSKIIANFGINIKRTSAYMSFLKKLFICKFTFNVHSYEELSELFEKLEHLDGVVGVKRLFLGRQVLFILASMVTFVVWTIHPSLLYIIAKDFSYARNPLLSNIVLFAGFFMLFALVFMLKRLTHHSFPEHRESLGFWLITLFLNVFAVITFFAEIHFFQLNLNWILILGLIFLILAYLAVEYLNVHKSKEDL